MTQTRVDSLVFRAYLVFTAYAFLVAAATNLSLTDLLPAVTFMWLSYLVFTAGEGRPRESSRHNMMTSCARRWPNAALACLALASTLAAVLSAQYYTGQSPSDVIETVSGGSSTYAAYQAYFAGQGLSSFAWSKSPYILMMTFTKAVAFISLISIITGRNTVTRFEKLYLIVVSAAHIYFGLARGTNFELFELGAVILFSLYWRNAGKKISFRRLLALGALLGASLGWFYYSIIARGYTFGSRISADVEYDVEGFLWNNSPALAFVTTMLFGYFGFGLFYLSYWISQVWFESLSNFAAGILPSGYHLISDSSLQSIMSSEIDFGVRWHPDSAVYINSLGIVGALVFIWALGRFARSLATDPEDWLTNSLRFMIFFQMVSWPVGNFVSVSTSTKLLVAVLISVLLKRRFEAFAALHKPGCRSEVRRVGVAVPG